MNDRAAAAAERAQHVRQRSDRPSQRRCAEHAGARAAALVPAQIEIRASASSEGAVEFHGYATVYERSYEMWDMWGPYDEIVSAGAGESSLARGDLDVPLVLQHDQLRRIARTSNGTLELSEDETGLSVHAPALDMGDADVAYIVPKLRAGLLDEMSFAFRIESGQWSPDYTEYRITRYDIHRGDVAIVGYGANPHTDAGVGVGVGVRSKPFQGSTRARALLELALNR